MRHDTSPEPSFTRTAPAASCLRSTQLTDPVYCASLLLEQLDEPAAVAQSDLLAGLALQCACQIALDYRRLEGLTTGGMDASMARTNSRGSPRDLLHPLPRRSDTSQQAAVRRPGDSDVLQELEERMVYIVDSHVEDSGVPDGQSTSLVRCCCTAAAGRLANSRTVYSQS